MAILHYRLTSANQNIVLSSGIDAQSFIFRRAIVQLVQPPAGAGGAPTVIPPGTDKNGGGVVIKPSHFSGFEVVSDQTGGVNDIMIGFEGDKITQTIYHDMEFDSEQITRGFQVQTKMLNNTANPLVLKDADFAPRGFDGPGIINPQTPPAQGQSYTPAEPGQIDYIDVFFQFESLYNYKSY